ncbi:potassium channel family protein [Jeotgalibacillus salarius]|uniref:Potassium channel protein n=1 Tax=Jeotgalibacillus salarius TaxID=546023 RepID=A0A4Y8LP32_9BACL|nr:potassium channel family protein [Jeotgalibacillus salarius]TFE03751.1 potassium channel protein [Jeotgalibacillus salarius]
MIFQQISRLPRWLFLICAVFFLIFFGGILIHLLEPVTFRSMGDGWWWALVTISTLGYGDLVPASTQGRLLAAFLLFIGAGLLSTYFFMFASYALHTQQAVREGAASVSKSKHTIVVGWNARAFYVLSKLQEDAIIIDHTLNAHPMYDVKRVDFIKGTAHQFSVLRQACIDKANVIIITADQHLNEEAADAQTILTILSAKKINPSIKCVAELISDQLIEQAFSAGADSVVKTKQVIGEALLSQHGSN